MTPISVAAKEGRKVRTDHGDVRFVHLVFIGRGYQCERGSLRSRVYTVIIAHEIRNSGVAMPPRSRAAAIPRSLNRTVTSYVIPIRLLLLLLSILFCFRFLSQPAYLLSFAPFYSTD